MGRCSTDEVIKLLLEDSKGSAIVEDQQNDGWTALHIASRNGHFDMVRYLVEVAGASVKNTAVDGRTALHFASCEGHTKIVQYLLNFSTIQTEAQQFL